MRWDHSQPQARLEKISILLGIPIRLDIVVRVYLWWVLLITLVSIYSKYFTVFQSKRRFHQIWASMDRAGVAPTTKFTVQRVAQHMASPNVGALKANTSQSMICYDIKKVTCLVAPWLVVTSYSYWPQPTGVGSARYGQCNCKCAPKLQNHKGWTTRQKATSSSIRDKKYEYEDSKYGDCSKLNTSFIKRNEIFANQCRVLFNEKFVWWYADPQARTVTLCYEYS